MPAAAEPLVPPVGRRAIVRALGRWYDAHRRELPWRRTRDPYAIWISEVMLQQTRVETVIPYYHRFLEQFPDVESLARAPLERVLRCWSGLGYYRRARQLWLAAAEVVAVYGGRMPRSAGELEQLCGVGRYTAGAVASIAYDEPVPVVDGNVGRVLARLFGLEQTMASSAGRRAAWELAAALVPKRRPGRFNQALMELGARVCRPARPLCDSCPLATHCVAHAEGRTSELPRRAPRRAPRPVGLWALVARHAPSGRILLARRPAKGLFGGLWEPPSVARDGPEPGGALRILGLGPRAKLEARGRVRHVLTHRRLELEVLYVETRRPWRLPPAPEPYQELGWRSADAVPLSTMAVKLLERAGVPARGA